MFWFKKEEDGLELWYKVSKLVEGRELEKALEVANKISDDRYRSRALYEVVKGYRLAGELEKALEIASKIKEDFWRFVALSDVGKEVSVFAEVGELDKALEIANMISDNYWRSRALKEIDRGYTKDKEPDKTKFW